MREIKFRAWNDLLKSMYNVSELYVDSDGKLKELGRFKTILMQFTGLKDLEGNEIYEGDIYHQGDSRILYEVVFSDDHSGFVGKQLGSGSLAGLKHFQSAIAIIGNLYENPELLEN